MQFRLTDSKTQLLHGMHLTNEVLKNETQF